MRNVKITAAQIIALRSATMRDNGSYELTTAKGQTITALIRAGVVVEGTRFLTVQGVSIMHSVSHVDVIASKGYRASVSDDVDSLAMFTLPARETASVDADTLPMGDASNDVPNVSQNGTQGVVIMGDDPSEWTPVMSELTGECYFGCGRPVTGMFVNYVGKTEGVCDFDREKLDVSTLVTPVDPSVWGGKGDDVATVGVVQNTPGMAGRTHYHAPGCRDIAREMRRYGQSQSDVIEFSFKSVAEILTFEYGDIASDNFQPETPEWWAEVMHNATIDASDVNGFGVKIMPCLDIPAGRAGDSPLIITDGFYRAGFDQPSEERRAEIAAEIAAHTCDETDCLYCEVNAQESQEDDTDGGFVETLVTKEYELSVIVDEITGTRVSLGWVTLTMNAAQCMDFDRVAEEYGRTQNTRTPRHGWASIITVHDVADI